MALLTNGAAGGVTSTRFHVKYHAVHGSGVGADGIAARSEMSYCVSVGRGADNDPYSMTSDLRPSPLCLPGPSPDKINNIFTSPPRQ